jgi:hypothetical protein
MKRIKQIFALAGCVAALCFTTSTVQAQGGGRNWDPAAMRQRMLDGVKDQMSITNDDEWKAIEPAITKVMEIGQEVMANRMRGMSHGMRGGGGSRGGDNNGGTNAAAGGGRNRGPFGGTPSPEFDALEKAIQDKAPADEVKDKLAKFREASAATEAKLAAAQEELKKLLTARQEAVAVISGLLK